MSQQQSSSTSAWNGAYEFKVVALMTIGFGLVGLDRFIINPLFPVIQKELNLNYQDLGLISGILALAWGLASAMSGPLSDRYGRKRVLVPAVLIFSLLVASTGLATGLFSMLLVRGLMGLAEGAYVPSSIVATIEASKPSRMGLNIGIQQMAAPFVGLGLGPVIGIALLDVLPSWHWVFAVIAVPGLVLAYVLSKVMRDTHASDATVQSNHIDQVSFKDILPIKSVWVNTLVMVCMFTSAIPLAIFFPNYMTDYLHLSLESMSQMMIGLGLGSLTGTVILPALSDRWGRKPLMVVGTLVSVVSVAWLPTVQVAGMELFFTIFLISFMNAGVIAITIGPLTHLTTPAHLVGTATGVGVGAAEMVGGAIAPAIAGAMAQHIGIEKVLTQSLVVSVISLLVILVAVKEPQKNGAPLSAA
jgi:MFS family permease